MKLEETLRLRVPAETKTALEAMALRLDRSIGWVVRQALEQYLKEERNREL